MWMPYVSTFDTETIKNFYVIEKIKLIISVTGSRFNFKVHSISNHSLKTLVDKLKGIESRF